MNGQQAVQGGMAIEPAGGSAWTGAIVAGLAIVDRAGRLIHVDEALCRMVGWTREELLGSDAPFLFWPEESRDLLGRALREWLDGRPPRRVVQTTFCRRTAERFPALLFVAPLLEDHVEKGLIANVIDLSMHMAQLQEVRTRTIEAQSLNAELDAQIGRYRTLLRSARDIILILDADGRITDMSETALRAYGYTADEMHRMRVFDLRPEELRATAQQQWRSAMTPQGVSFESVHQRKDGSRADVPGSGVSLCCAARR